MSGDSLTIYGIRAIPREIYRWPQMFVAHFVWDVRKVDARRESAFLELVVYCLGLPVELQDAVLLVLG